MIDEYFKKTIDSIKNQGIKIFYVSASDEKEVKFEKLSHDTKFAVETYIYRNPGKKIIKVDPNLNINCEGCEECQKCTSCKECTNCKDCCTIAYKDNCTRYRATKF